jgi:hypothetical protein
MTSLLSKDQFKDVKPAWPAIPQKQAFFGAPKDQEMDSFSFKSDGKNKIKLDSHMRIEIGPLNKNTM